MKYAYLLLMMVSVSRTGISVAAEDGNIEQVLPQPSKQQIEKALELGRTFQGMATRQLEAQSGNTVPLQYVYSPELVAPFCYLAPLPSYPHRYFEYSPYRQPYYHRPLPCHVRPPLMRTGPHHRKPKH